MKKFMATVTWTRAEFCCSPVFAEHSPNKASDAIKLNKINARRDATTSMARHVSAGLVQIRTIARTRDNARLIASKMQKGLRVKGNKAVLFWIPFTRYRAYLICQHQFWKFYRCIGESATFHVILTVDTKVLKLNFQTCYLSKELSRQKLIVPNDITVIQ